MLEKFKVALIKTTNEKEEVPKNILLKYLLGNKS